MSHGLPSELFILVRAVLLLVAFPTSGFSQTCTVSMPAIVFGNVDVLPGVAVDVTSTVTVGCSGGSTQGQRICISMGAEHRFARLALNDFEEGDAENLFEARVRY